MFNWEKSEHTRPTNFMHSKMRRFCYRFSRFSHCNSVTYLSGFNIFRELTEHLANASFHNHSTLVSTSQILYLQNIETNWMSKLKSYRLNVTVWCDCINVTYCLVLMYGSQGFDHKSLDPDTYIDFPWFQPYQSTTLNQHLPNIGLQLRFWFLIISILWSSEILTDVMRAEWSMWEESLAES